VQHLAYPKIPAVLAGDSVGGTWIATEKVHGAQLVVAYDGRDLRVGKRRSWLRGGEPFFGWQLLRGRLERAAAGALARGGVAVRLYGELYGGHYPHPSVTPSPGASAVQTGIWYSPDVRFALFDVLTHASPGDAGGYGTYVDVAAIAADAGLDVVPLLAKGARSTVDTVPVRFPSRLPAALGLPELPGNLAEGVVLRPDAALSPAARPILKLKIPEFDERRFGGSRPWDAHAFIAGADLQRLARTLVNAARLASARSKVGPDDPAALADEVVLDVLIDLTDAFPTAMAALSETAQHDLETAIRAAAP
jgi:Rnl2 family RNA ligase